jgi:hypothetical protein
LKGTFRPAFGPVFEAYACPFDKRISQDVEFRTEVRDRTAQGRFLGGFPEIMPLRGGSVWGRWRKALGGRNATKACLRSCTSFAAT